MNRTKVIQKLLDRKAPSTYLEIGVHTGDNFFPIKAGRKIAVDPQFAFSTKRRMWSALTNPHNIVARYHQLESDSYFRESGSSVSPDVVFIDGLHTYEQSLRDVENALGTLHEDGVIVMHDCNPPNEAAAHPAQSLAEAASLDLPGWTDEWCGDVWKTVCHLRSTRADLRVFVLDCDYGLGIVTRGDPLGRLDFTAEAIRGMSYDDLARDRERLLNLKPESYFAEFLETV